ncbi:MAG TPA: FecR family protein, partial [Polyangiaceae bacterium]|nr:FecR family protein [Polyangiaceae bacterium]
HGLDAGQSIVAPAGAPTSVVLASGTQIALDAKSVLECREDTATQRFALLRGGAHLHVSKLSGGERFLVDTPQAEVEVRGTVFDVRIEPATAECGARTSVAVTEGRVEVRSAGSARALLPGDHWTSPCETPAVEASDDAAPKRTAAVTAHPNHARSAPARASDEAPVSALSEQNDLYARAEAARRDGRTGEALAAYARLLALFPNGQLAESAFVQRVRLLAQSDPARASADAERYLTRYPAGFARGEMAGLTRAP